MAWNYRALHLTHREFGNELFLSPPQLLWPPRTVVHMRIGEIIVQSQSNLETN